MHEKRVGSKGVASQYSVSVSVWGLVAYLDENRHGSQHPSGIRSLHRITVDTRLIRQDLG